MIAALDDLTALQHHNGVGVIFKRIVVERFQKRCVFPPQLMPTEGDGIPLL